jgi:DNA-binding MarR family transcriptional regulator
MLPFDPIEEAQRHWEAHGWHDAAPGMAAVTSIVRVHQLLVGEIDRVLRPHDLTLARYEVLMLLLFTREGALPLGKIGQRLQVHPASVTNAVDRLEAQRLVRRRAHPTDRRTVLATLTAKGRTVAETATDDVNAVFASLDLPSGLFDQLREVRAAAGDFARFSTDVGT